MFWSLELGQSCSERIPDAKCFELHDFRIERDNPGGTVRQKTKQLLEKMLVDIIIVIRNRKN